MDKKARKHSICEKMPYIAIILSMLIPMLFTGIGASIGGTILGIIALCMISKNKLYKANEIWDKKWSR